MKLAWNINMPRTNHTWMVDNLLCCELPSARERIMAGFVGFLKRMRNSASWEVRIISDMVARDAGSVTGGNIISMRKEFKKDPREMTPKELRMMIKGAEVPSGQEWKMHLLEEMLEERQERLEAGEEGEDFKLLQSYIEILAEV